MKTPWILVRKHLLDHWVRSGLTIAAVTIATYLFCFLASIITSLDGAVSQSASNRLFTQSAVSLFVQLPLDYQEKIAGVEGVADTSKFQWFGGYYKDMRQGFFAQFAVDHERFWDLYRKEMEIIQGPDMSDPQGSALEAFSKDRRACVIGTDLQKKFGFEVGQTVELQASLFHKDNNEAWDFLVVGVYKALKQNVDQQTMYFRWDYFQTTLENRAFEPFTPECGVYVSEVAAGHDPAVVLADIDQIFAEGPQKSLTFTEAAFQAGFVSMLGNVPRFLGSIGGAVVLAVLFSVINTMILATRQRIREVGVLKSLGFGNGAVALLMVGESLFLSGTGGLLGSALAVGAEEGTRKFLGTSVGNYAMPPELVIPAIGIAVAIGLIAGLTPAVMVFRLRPIRALRGDA